MVFNENVLKNTDLQINNEELTNDDVEEITSQVEEISKNVSTQNVEENNITAKYTGSYKSVKINNQSDYKITEDMLKPDVEIENKKDILIYHTHTCESYTPSKRF